MNFCIYKIFLVIKKIYNLSQPFIWIGPQAGCFLLGSNQCPRMRAIVKIWGQSFFFVDFSICYCAKRALRSGYLKLLELFFQH